MRNSFITLKRELFRFLGSPLGASAFFFFLSDICQYLAGKSQTEMVAATTAVMISGVLRQIVGGVGVFKDLATWTILGRSEAFRMHWQERFRLPHPPPALPQWKQAFYLLVYPTRFNGAYIVWAGVMLLISAMLYADISAWGRALVACSFLWSGCWFWVGNNHQIKLASAGFIMAVAASWLEYSLTLSQSHPLGNFWLFQVALYATIGSVLMFFIRHKE